MDWRAAASAFVIIFLAELADKTQLMLIGMSARAKSPHMVFLGAAMALIASSLLAVVAGEYILRAVPIRAVRMGTGVAFLGIGALMIYRATR